MRKRRIQQVVQGMATQDGAGVELVRVLSKPNVYDFDPFLMLDAFDSKDPKDYILGFPWHPHRGIETVTYLVDGIIEHQDSLGNKGIIGPGDCQWMSAGGGILHQEMPKPAKHMFGVQLWLNMARRDKMTPPKYRDIVHDKIPTLHQDNVSIKVLSGEILNTKGAITPDYVPMTFLDVQMAENASCDLPTSENDNVFVYILKGEIICGEDGIFRPSKKALLTSKGNLLSMKTGQSSAQLLVFMAPSLNEPIAWGGPIVMNTDEELRQAFREIRNNTFIK
ncbi:MAG: pirin family protein [Bacilli bacterium]|nr:pirin family protein [Bacilli bacterium]